MFPLPALGFSSNHIFFFWEYHLFLIWNICWIYFFPMFSFAVLVFSANYIFFFWEYHLIFIWKNCWIHFPLMFSLTASGFSSSYSHLNLTFLFAAWKCIAYTSKCTARVWNPQCRWYQTKPKSLRRRPTIRTARGACNDFRLSLFPCMQPLLVWSSVQ